MTLTERWTDFDAENAEKVQYIVSFVKESANKWGQNDKILRILAATHGLHKTNELNDSGILKTIDLGKQDHIKSLQLCITYLLLHFS